MSERIFDSELKAALDAALDPRRVAVGKTGPLKGIPYLESHAVIRTANAIFGYGNWGFQIASLPQLVEGGEQGANHTAYQVWAVAGTLTLAGGQSFTDVGTCVRSGGGSSGLEMAIKGAASDALKRCLRHFGDQFGLVLYDKDVTAGDMQAWYEGEHQPASQPAPNRAEPRQSTPTSASPRQPAPGGSIIKDGKVDWNAFWAEARALGYKDGAAVATVAGDVNWTKWQAAGVDGLMRKLRRLANGEVEEATPPRTPVQEPIAPAVQGKVFDIDPATMEMEDRERHTMFKAMIASADAMDCGRDHIYQVICGEPPKNGSEVGFWILKDGPYDMERWLGKNRGKGIEHIISEAMKLA